MAPSRLVTCDLNLTSTEFGPAKVDLMTVTASARAILQTEGFAGMLFVSAIHARMPAGEQDVQMRMAKKTSLEANISVICRAQSFWQEDCNACQAARVDEEAQACSRSPCKVQEVLTQTCKTLV